MNYNIKYKFISLGNNCSIKYNLDIHIGKGETLFFDWLLTDMNSVNKLLSCINIDEVININSINRIGGNSYKNLSKVSFTTLNKCISMHDLPLKYDNNEVSDFVKKYKQRYFRIIDLIKNSSIKLYFLIYGNITNDEIDQFITIIKNINNLCNFKLVTINNNNSLYESNYVLHINLNDYVIEGKQILLEDYWKAELWDWNRIFNFILEN